jgi:hypothetical protein
LEAVEDGVLVMKFISEDRDPRSLFLQCGMSSLNLDATERCKPNVGTVPYLESYYPTYSRNPRFTWNGQILVKQDKALPRYPGGSNGGCKESVHEIRYKPSLHRPLRLQAKANQIENSERFLSMPAPDFTFQLQVY